MSEGNVPFPTRGLIADSRPRARLMESGVSAHDSVAGVIAIFQEQSRGVISELPATHPAQPDPLQGPCLRI
jgi:hypothetical protein